MNFERKEHIRQRTLTASKLEDKLVDCERFQAIYLLMKFLHISYHISVTHLEIMMCVNGMKTLGC